MQARSHPSFVSLAEQHELPSGFLILFFFFSFFVINKAVGILMSLCFPLTTLMKLKSNGYSL